MNLKKKKNLINELLNSEKKNYFQKEKALKTKFLSQNQESPWRLTLHFEAMLHYNENLNYTAHVLCYNYNLVKEKAAKNRNLPSLAYSQV